MSLTITTTLGSPTSGNIKRFGKGCWRVSAFSVTEEIVYSTNGLDWYQLNHANSPITLYSTELYVDQSQDAIVNQVSHNILPNYSQASTKSVANKVPSDISNPDLDSVYSEVNI